jgi:3-phenylpropionate/cinnamic acid dioxygenase small subunit
MLVETDLHAAVSALLFEEADCLDERRWQDWLDMFQPDAVFWVPAWHDDVTLTSDPRTEISLIYCGSRERLSERVWRIESGMSSSLIRLPRTRHFITNIRVLEADAAEVRATANFQVNSWKLAEQTTDIFFGQYRYRLERSPSGLRIREKYVIVANDLIPRQMDVFSI